MFVLKCVCRDDALFVVADAYYAEAVKCANHELVALVCFVGSKPEEHDDNSLVIGEDCRNAPARLLYAGNCHGEHCDTACLVAPLDFLAATVRSEFFERRIEGF